MKVGLVAPPWIPIPAPAYGGIEAVLAGLARQLAGRGHDVALAAAPGSAVEGVRVIAPLGHPPAQIGLTAVEWAHLIGGLRALEDQDVVIDHSGPLGALLAGTAGPPALHVVHGPLRRPERTLYEEVCRRAPRLRLVAISERQRLSAPMLPWAGVAYNGIDVDALPLGQGAGGYLLFLGRMSPDKGVVEAIGLARRAGRPLLIAAKCREAEEQAFFDAEVAPRLGDGIEWLGEVGGDDKVALLADAAALVFPIRWPEPFGMVMIEAMAVGTPVLATPLGAVPEVVEDGVTGFVRDDPDELADAVGRLGEIDRAACRAHVRARFSHRAMGDAYAALLADARARAARSVRSPGPRIIRPLIRSADSAGPDGNR